MGNGQFGVYFVDVPELMGPCLSTNDNIGNSAFTDRRSCGGFEEGAWRESTFTNRYLAINDEGPGLPFSRSLPRSGERNLVGGTYYDDYIYKNTGFYSKRLGPSGAAYYQSSNVLTPMPSSWKSLVAKYKTTNGTQLVPGPPCCGKYVGPDGTVNWPASDYYKRVVEHVCQGYDRNADDRNAKNKVGFHKGVDQQNKNLKGEGSDKNGNDSTNDEKSEPYPEYRWVGRKSGKRTYSGVWGVPVLPPALGGGNTGIDLQKYMKQQRTKSQSEPQTLWDGSNKDQRNTENQDFPRPRKNKSDASTQDDESMPGLFGNFQNQKGDNGGGNLQSSSPAQGLPSSSQNTPLPGTSKGPGGGSVLQTIPEEEESGNDQAPKANNMSGAEASADKDRTSDKLKDKRVSFPSSVLGQTPTEGSSQNTPSPRRNKSDSSTQYTPLNEEPPPLTTPAQQSTNAADNKKQPSNKSPYPPVPLKNPRNAVLLESSLHKSLGASRSSNTNNKNNPSNSEAEMSSRSSKSSSTRNHLSDPNFEPIPNTFNRHFKPWGSIDRPTPVKRANSMPLPKHPSPVIPPGPNEPPPLTPSSSKQGQLIRRKSAPAASSRTGSSKTKLPIPQSKSGVNKKGK